MLHKFKFCKMRFKPLIADAYAWKCSSNNNSSRRSRSIPVLTCICSTLLFILLCLTGKTHSLIIGANPRRAANSLNISSDPSISYSREDSSRIRTASLPSNVTTKARVNYTDPDDVDSFYNGSVASREARRSVVSGGIFSLISFENVPCNATTGEVGVCFSIRECQNLGGTPAGPCAGSYGTCCVLTAGCGSTISINNTYIVNPGWPSATAGPLSCTITINLFPGASQLYLEYDKFLLDGPTNGNCVTDSMIITIPGVPSTYPVLCGNNSGQNDYFSLGKATGPVKITFKLAANSDQRCWKIRVVEFKPTDSCAAPAGCTQFLQSVSGTIETYNYNGGQGQLLNNYCINICFQAHTGYCNLLLTEGNFMLSGIAPSDCMDDFLLANGVKFCGETLNNGMLQVNCTTTPIMITFCSGKGKGNDGWSNNGWGNNGWGNNGWGSNGWSKDGWGNTGWDSNGWSSSGGGDGWDSSGGGDGWSDNTSNRALGFSLNYNLLPCTTTSTGWGW